MHPHDVREYAAPYQPMSWVDAKSAVIWGIGWRAEVFSIRRYLRKHELTTVIIVRSKDTRKVAIHRLSMRRVRGGPDMYSDGSHSAPSCDFLIVTMIPLSSIVISDISD